MSGMEIMRVLDVMVDSAGRQFTTLLRMELPLDHNMSILPLMVNARGIKLQSDIKLRNMSELSRMMPLHSWRH